jgi:hypothetical protein
MSEQAHNEVQSIEILPPTWEAAVRIYCAVLRNPEAGAKAHLEAEKDLLRLARHVDTHVCQ